ncbi:MAG: hydroxymethylglutaryl-CoA reductase (NADPH) [Candidatus Wukongarchaeota archaeon]|nr:hydroxymethylglutaryl-CoA reductase (NADPH) [Candidatus Wukongarchaeota archaeon]
MVISLVEVEDVVDRLVRGDLKFHEIEELVGGDANVATKIRRLALEKITNKDLSSLVSTLDFNELCGRNIECPVGSVEIPIGIVKIKVKGDYADDLYYFALATTEGALVASVNRGCSAINVGGGARAKVYRDQMTRAPVFACGNVENAFKLKTWVEEHFDEIKKVCESTTRHGKLVKISPYLVGDTVFLRFIFTTGDALGMNLVTIATEAAVNFIVENLPFPRCVSLSGNLCADKKPAAINFIEGRGKSVIAEAAIPREIVEKKLKTTPEAICEVNLKKNFIGSALGYSPGINAHFANMVAAAFIAYGQDVAQTVESSLGITTTSTTPEGDLYGSVTLPCLEVGTIGGGTRLPRQKNLLELLSCEGGGDPPGTNALKFAEILSAVVLGGELSLLAALAAGHLAKAHIKLGRSNNQQLLK